MHSSRPCHVLTSGIVKAIPAITLEGGIIMRADTRQILMIFTGSAILIYATALPWLFALVTR